MIVTANLLQTIDSNKVIPIIRQVGTHTVPTFLTTKLFIDFSRSDEYEIAFDNLSRAIHDAPLFKKPPVGNNPFIAVENVRPDRTGDMMLKIMQLVVDLFEGTETSYVEYVVIKRYWEGSRVMLDLTIDQAIADGLLKKPSPGYLQLTTKGKQYALHHKLVK